jgi:hypothetical protein
MKNIIPVKELNTKKMIRVATYMKTSGRKKFKEFLQKPFSVDMLAPVFGEASVDTLFDGWRGKDMVNWYRFINEDGITLEFYPEGSYNVKNKKQDKSYQLKTPKTIDDFINDMNKLNILIYWTKWIDENFEPKEYLAVDEIKNYYVDLLAKMGKSHELL